MRKLSALFLFFVLLSSCETWDYYELNDFNFGTEDHNIRIFIDGGITSQYLNHRIYLTKPGSFVDNSKQEPIRNAQVYVVCQNDTFNYEIVESVWGEYEQQYIDLEIPFYQSSKKFSAIPGLEYVLHVEYSNETYTASDVAQEAYDFNYSEIPLPLHNEYGLAVKKHNFGFPKSCIYLWNKKKYLSDTSNYITEIHAKSYVHQFADVQGVFANGTYYTHFTDGNDSSGDTIFTVLQTISDAYYNYLSQGFNETDWKESTFATITGNLPTNVSEGGAGFFYVSDFYKKEITIEALLNYNLN